MLTRRTKEQQKALLAVYNRDVTVAPSFLAFRRTSYLASSVDCVVVAWRGMWLGIEPDGYTHS